MQQHLNIQTEDIEPTGKFNALSREGKLWCYLDRVVLMNVKTLV